MYIFINIHLSYCIDPLPHSFVILSFSTLSTRKLCCCAFVMRSSPNCVGKAVILKNALFYFENFERLFLKCFRNRFTNPLACGARLSGSPKMYETIPVEMYNVLLLWRQCTKARAVPSNPSLKMLRVLSKPKYYINQISISTHRSHFIRLK